MATSTYNLIASQVVGSGGASAITFSSIPQTYTDLLLKISARMAPNTTGEYIQMSFNGVTTNLSSKILYGYTTNASSYNESSVLALGIFPGVGTTSNTFGTSETYIPNYTSSNYKSVSTDEVSENNSSSTNAAYQYLIAGLWSSTAAITSITLSAQTTSILQYSTFYLYGIKNS